jgi:hypothetical protein
MYHFWQKIGRLLHRLQLRSICGFTVVERFLDGVHYTVRSPVLLEIKKRR